MRLPLLVQMARADTPTRSTRPHHRLLRRLPPQLALGLHYPLPLFRRPLRRGGLLPPRDLPARSPQPSRETAPQRDRRRPDQVGARARRDEEPRDAQVAAVEGRGVEAVGHPDRHDRHRADRCGRRCFRELLLRVRQANLFPSLFHAADLLLERRLIYLLFEGYPIIFSEVHQLGPGYSSLPFLSILVGAIISGPSASRSSPRPIADKLNSTLQFPSPSGTRSCTSETSSAKADTRPSSDFRLPRRAAR